MRAGDANSGAEQVDEQEPSRTRRWGTAICLLASGLLLLLMGNLYRVTRAHSAAARDAPPPLPPHLRVPA